MKKGYLLPAAMLALILLFSLAAGTAISRCASRCQASLQLADAQAQAEQWPEAMETLLESYEDWTENQRWLHVLSRHDVVDGAETMYCRAITFAAAREYSEFRAELADLDAQLQLLADAEHLSLENIL